MSYSDVAAMVEDWDLRLRLIAAAAQEHDDDPGRFVDAQVWRVCGTKGWDTAWAKAVAAYVNEPEYRPGADQKVITDAMITAAVRGQVAAIAAKATAQVRGVGDGDEARIKAEDDREFNRMIRLRQWEIDHLPAHKPPPAAPEEPDA